MKKTNFLNSFGGSRSPLFPLGYLVRLFLQFPPLPMNGIWRR